MKETDLSTYPKTLNIGAGKLKQISWFFINAFIFKSYWFPIVSIKRLIIRLYGAKIGKGVVFKPNVNIKFPWKLSIDDYTWIGEGVWIDNLEEVHIGRNCCLSQGAIIITGNHNYKRTSFDLMLQKVKLEDGVWIGAGSKVAPGVIAGSHSVLTMGSVATHNLEAYTIYKGNPAQAVKTRELE